MQNKKFVLINVLFALTVLLFVGAVMADDVQKWEEYADISWYNTTDSSFTITTPQQLAGLAVIVNSGDAVGTKDSFKGKTVMLGNDIDLSGRVWTAIGGASAFSGTFDGNGNTVSGLGTVVPYGSSNYYGLFGYINGGTTIKNLNITGDVSISGSKCWNLGALAGYAYGSSTAAITVRNCTFSGTIKGYATKRTGGLIGYGENISMSNCTVRANVTADSSMAEKSNKTLLAGIIGYIGGSSSVENCLFEGTIKYADNITVMRVGGVAAEINSSSVTVQNCAVSADIDVKGGADPYGTDMWNNCVGGVAGYNTGLISNTSVTGAVALYASDDKYAVNAGSIAGYNSYGASVSVENSVASCPVSAKSLSSDKVYEGSLVGYNAYNQYSPTVNRGKILNNRWVKKNGVPQYPAGNWNVISGDYLGVGAIVSNDTVSAESELPVAAVLIPSILNLAENKSYMLTAKLYPQSSSKTDAVELAWSSSAPAVAAVKGNGLTAVVNGLKSGTANIMLSAGKLLGDVNTYAPATFAGVRLVNMEGLKLSPGNISFDEQGQSTTITATILPNTDKPSYPALKWTFKAVSGEGAADDDLSITYKANSLSAVVTLKNYVQGAVYRVTAAAVDDSKLTDSVDIHITAPVVPAAQGSSSGGCSTGIFSVLFLALLPSLVFIRKK